MPVSEKPTVNKKLDLYKSSMKTPNGVIIDHWSSTAKSVLDGK